MFRATVIQRFFFLRCMFDFLLYARNTLTAVQNERQPRNSATLRPEVLAEMDHERIIREAAAAVGAFG